MESGSQWTVSFVMIFGISNLLYCTNWQSGEVLLQTKWAESFFMLLLDASINERTECILSHCRNNPVIYWGKCQMNWFICDNINDLFCIYQIHKDNNYWSRPHELSSFSYYFLTPQLVIHLWCDIFKTLMTKVRDLLLLQER